MRIIAAATYRSLSTLEHVIQHFFNLFFFLREFNLLTFDLVLETAIFTSQANNLIRGGHLASLNNAGCPSS
jgi:hypothetical protein